MNELWQVFKKEVKVGFITFFQPVTPSFWRAFAQAKGAKAKFNCWLNWPEDTQ